MTPPAFSRRLLERVSRNLSLRRRLPARFGGATLCVSPGAALAYYRRLDGPAWRELFDFATHCVPRDATVWDVGASMGVFGFAAAHVTGPGGRVLLVEADTWTVEFLKASARTPRPGAAPVHVLCGAVADRVALQQFEIPERGRAGSHLASSAGAGGALLGRTRESHPAITVSLDWLAANYGPPAVIKLDIEGVEFPALEGATRVLERHRPALFVEVYERSTDALTALLHRHRYRLFDLSRGWEARTPIERATYNTLALPV